MFRSGIHKLVACGAILLVNASWGQDTLRLVRLNHPVVLDGRVEEPAWEAVPPLPLVVLVPQYRMAPTERTEIRVAYDERYLYVSGRLYDSDPKGIRARTLYRDAFAGDDHFCFALDTYNDRLSAAWFCVNPAGNRIDQTIGNDGDLATINRDWNTYWDAATTQNEQGWFAEIRIPFSSLGFLDHQGRVVMGLSAYRFIARKNERHIFPDMPPTVQAFFIPVKPSRMARVLFEGIRRRTPVYVAPYSLVGRQQQAQLNTAAYNVLHDNRQEVGLDVRYSPSPSFSIDFTANTDFAQVEADDQQINLTRFPLFFPEKRQFFQERAELFEFGLGGPFNRLFHSRSIGLVEGRPIRLLGGVRMVGRMGGTDLGLLTMQTAAERELPAENFGVLRVRQRVLNPNSNVGLMLTSRIGDDGSYNVASGLDALLRLVGEEYVTLRFAHTFAKDQESVSFPKASHLLLRWERRAQGGFSYATEVVHSGAAFNPGIGFLLRRNFTAVNSQLQYLWFGGPASPLRTYTVRGTLAHFLRNEKAAVESAQLTPTLEAEFKSGNRLNVSYRANYESVLSPFAIAPQVLIPTGNYWFHELELMFISRPGVTLRPNFTLTAGQFFDGYRTAVELRPTLNASRHVELGADYSLNWIRFPNRNQKIDMHLLRLRLRFAYDVRLSLSALLQYNSVSDRFDVNMRLRYNFRDGRDLWIVYNETLHTDRKGWHPRPPLSLGRAFLVKYTHTFIW